MGRKMWWWIIQAIDIVSNLAFPVFLIVFLIIAAILVLRGKIGKFDINEALKPKYIITGNANNISLSDGRARGPINQ